MFFLRASLPLPKAMSGHVMYLQLVSGDKIPGEGFHSFVFFQQQREKTKLTRKNLLPLCPPLSLAGIQMRGVGVQQPSRDVRWRHEDKSLWNAMMGSHRSRGCAADGILTPPCQSRVKLLWLSSWAALLYSNHSQLHFILFTS